MLSTIEGLEVYGFTSPSDAFEHIRLNVLNYDLVLSDFKMPEIIGIELLTKIKELKPSVKALL
ncbi:MAG: response regulator, partial [Nitrososphaeraceae archaeon]